MLALAIASVRLYSLRRDRLHIIGAARGAAHSTCFIVLGSEIALTRRRKQQNVVRRSTRSEDERATLQMLEISRLVMVAQVTVAELAERAGSPRVDSAVIAERQRMEVTTCDANYTYVLRHCESIRGEKSWVRNQVVASHAGWSKASIACAHA